MNGKTIHILYPSLATRSVSLMLQVKLGTHNFNQSTAIIVTDVGPGAYTMNESVFSANDLG